MDEPAIHYDPQRALHYASQFSTPRLVGTEEEQAIGRQIAACLEGFGYQVDSLPFSFSDASSLVLAAEIIFIQVLIGITLWLHYLSLPAQSISALFILLLIVFLGPINRLVQVRSLASAPLGLDSSRIGLFARLGKRYQTSNYWAKLRGAAPEPGGAQLILVAHYDTKSQAIPLVVRIALFVIGIGGSAMFAGLVLADPSYLPLSVVAQIVGAISLLAGIPLWFLSQGNASPGAIDDASGVGVVLHLAEALSSHPEVCRQLGLSILITSAEELSTMGSVAFVRQYGPQLRQQAKAGRVYVLNFDGPGVNGKLYWVGKESAGEQTAGPSLLSLARQACKELDLPLGRFTLPGALFDHIPFSDLGLEAGSLIAVGRDSLKVHTPQDTPDRLDVRGFDQAGRVALHMIHRLIGLPGAGQAAPCQDFEKRDIYTHDPVLRFLRDQTQLTPNRALALGLGLGMVDLMIARSYGLWYSRAGIIGALQDPPYLLTIFVILPLFLRTYVWMPDGLACIFQSLPANHLILDRDMPIYRNNVRLMLGRFNHSWFVITLLIAILLEVLVIIGNASYPDTYNTARSARLVLFRIPYGLLGLYAATAVVVRSILNGDWSQLTRDIEPQIHPMHPDMAAGYGAFTHCIINMLGIFVGIATFFFTKALFQPATDRVTFQPVYNSGIIISTILYMIVGFVLFLYIPSGAARRAIRQAKRKQLERLAAEYSAEQQELLEMVQPRPVGIPDVQAVQSMKVQIERLKLLNEAITLVENVPSSPINRKTVQRFGLSYLSIYLSTLVYNFLRAYLSDTTAMQFRALIEQGSLAEILRGFLRILFTGQL
jgi:Peptidase family M28